MDTTDNPEFKPFTNDFTEEEALNRRARAIAASKNLFQTDISKLDDAQVSGLYQATARALFQIEDPDGKVAFGKKAGDARTNVGLLRDFCKGNYKLIQDDEYESWLAMDEEQRFRYALENEGAENKAKSYFQRRGLSISDLAGAGMPGAQFGNVFQNAAAPGRDEVLRKQNYENLTPEEQAVYRKDVIEDYEKKLSKRQVLATYLAMTDGLSDRASTLLAKAYNTGTVDVEAMEALPQKERDQAYTALSIMRGDQKKGHILGIPTDFTDDTAANRLQLCLYGFQQGLVGLIPDTYELGKDITKAAYAKFCLDDAERKRYIDRWDAQVRMEQALKQGLPEAESWWGAGFQGAAESFALMVPYLGIGKGGKMMRAATAVGEDASWWKKAVVSLNPLRAGSQHRARAKLVEGVKAVEEADYADTFARLSQWKTVGGGDLTVGNQLLARQLANIENYTKELRELKKLSGADLRKWGLGAASWSAGEATSFGSFAKEYVETCDATGISRYDSVPMAAVVGLVNAQIENLYVPGLESTLSASEVKSLMFGSLLQAVKSDGAKGFWTWLGNRIEKGVVEGVKVTATEGMVEEPLQQIVTEHGKAIAETAGKLRENGQGDLADSLTAYWDATKDTLANDFQTFVDTAVDTLPSSVVFGLTTIGNQTRRQKLHNIMTRHENRAKYAREVELAKSEGREIPAPPVMLSKAENGSLQFNPNGVDYDAGIADMIGRAAATQKAVTDYWAGDGQEREGEDVRLANALAAARKAWDTGEGDVYRQIADAAQVDMRTAEVIAEYFIAEDETKLYSPQLRAFADYSLSAADMSEKTLERILPGYVKGSYKADEKNGVYSGQVKLEDGSVKTIAYKVGDISEELMKVAEEEAKIGSSLGVSHDARIRNGTEQGGRTWAQMSDQERYAYALRGVNALSSGAGVFEVTEADGTVSRISADDVIYLSNGRLGDIGYGAMATLGTARHETWHAIWRFAKSSFTEAERQNLAKKLGIDVTAENWEVELDEAMAYQFELYASGAHVPHVATGAIDRLMQSTAAKWIGELSKFGLADEVKNAKTGKAFALADFYDAVMRGEIGTGRLGIAQVATETPQQKAAEPQKKTQKELPVGVSEEELAEAERAAAEAAAVTAPETPEQTKPQPSARATQPQKQDYTLDSPANASVPDARFYRISAGDGVDLVGELVVSDARDLKTSYKGNLSDPSLQNRAETNEGRSLVEKIAGSPDTLQVGTVQPRANNGFVWTTPSLDTFIGNTRESGISAAYEKGNAAAVKAYMLAEVEKRGIEVPEGIEQPIVHFVLRRIESKDGKASIQDVVRMTNQSVNRGMNVYEQAKNDADVLAGAGLVPHIAIRPDGRIDTAKSAEAIGRFIQETGAQGMVDENTDTLTEDGQTRLQNAVLATLLGNENSDTVAKMMREADRLDIENEKRSLMKTAAELMRIAAEKQQYDLRQPLAEALDYYLNWRDVDERKREEVGKNRRDWYERTKDGMRKRGLTWEMHMGQGDMFRTPSPEARLLGDLLAASRDLRSFDAEDRETDAGKKRAQDLVTGFLGDYIRNADAIDTKTDDMFGTPPPSRIELLETHRGTDASRRFSTAAIDSLKDARTASSVTEAGEKLRVNGAVNRPLTNSIIGLTAKITGNGLSKMTSEKATKKSKSPYLHALAVANADKIFECAFVDATHPDTHGRKEVSLVHRLGSMLYDPQAKRFEPVLVTMLEYRRDGEKVYTIEAVDVDAYQKKNSAGQMVAFADGERQTPIAEYMSIIAKTVAEFNGEKPRFSTTGLYPGSAADYDAVPERLNESLSRLALFDPQMAADISALKKAAEKNIRNGADDTPSESEARYLRKKISEYNSNARDAKKKASDDPYMREYWAQQEKAFRDYAKDYREQLKALEEDGIGEDGDLVDWYRNADFLEMLDAIESGEASSSAHFDPNEIYRGSEGPFAYALNGMRESSLFKGKDTERFERVAKKINVAYKAIESDIENPRGPFGEPLFSTIAANLSTESRLRRTNASTQTDTPAFKAWFADSKIVDGEGRPLRVYRGAEFNPVKQPDGKGVIKPMSYFSADPDYAKRYGEVEAYYLKIEHPFDIRDPECEADFKKVYPNVTLARGDSGALDWAEAATVDDEFLEENFPGKYDGIIFDEQKDWTTEGNTAKWRGLSYVPLFGGSQVKSATDNRGTFDPANRDVRFSTVSTDTPAFKAWFGKSKMVDKDGRPRIFWHGTNWNILKEKKGKAVFDDAYRGTGSGDMGFFGRGHYFAYTEGEASYYGRNVIPVFLKIENPFDFQKELDTLWGKRTALGFAGDLAPAVNLAEKFPEIAKEYTATYIGDEVGIGEYELKKISLADFAKEAERVHREVKFEVVRIENSNEVIVRAEPHKVKEGTAEWTEYRFEERYFSEKDANDELSRVYNYLEKVLFPNLELPKITDVMQGKEFTDAIKAKGHDGIIQSEDGDEAVVFDSRQVKSATHNRGTFDPANQDIRYSTVGRFGAANLGIEGSLEASRMEEAGVDRVDIWRQTGWWRGNDGKWRVEVDPPYLADRSKFEFLKGGELVYLGDLFPDSPVIRAYGLEWTPVIIDFDGERQVLNGATAAYGFQINGKEGIILSPSLVRNADTKPSAAQLHMLENFSSDYAAFSKEFWRIFNEYDKLGEEKADEQERKAREEFGATNAAKIYEDIRSENGERFIPNERFLSVMTHEIQHIIQDREGFAKGGNPGLYSKGPSTAEIDDRIAGLNAELDKVIAAGEDRDAFDRLRKEIKEAEDEKMKLQKDARDKAILRYQLLAGEVEARNVEKRLKMPIEKRLATPPWETDDVKADDQIVRFSTVALPGGKEVSVSDAWQYRRPDGTLQDRRYSKFLAKSGGTGETSAEINSVLDRLQAGIHVDTEEIEATPEWAGAMARAKAVEADVKRKYGVEYTFEIFTPERDKLTQSIIKAALSATVTRTTKVDGSDVPFEMNEALKDGESYEVKRDREVCIVIGLPSAGKSSVFVNALSKHYAARVCDSDAVKKVLPEFDEGYGGNAVHEESSEVNIQIFRAAAERGDNIILPILGHKPEKLREHLDFFKGKGYTTHLFFNELPAEKAKARLIMRFLENGRYLPLTCVTKAGDSTINSYNEVKNEADEYAHCSNDVGRGSDPRIIESSVGAEELARQLGFRTVGTLGRSGLESGRHEAARGVGEEAGTSVKDGSEIIESSSGAEKLARQLGFRTDGDLGRSGRQPGGSETAGGVGEESGPSVNAAAPRRSFSTVGSAYPGLNRLSDEQLIAVALALKTVFGKAGKKQSQHFTINEVQRHIKALHPDWNGPKVSLESTRIYQLVRPIKAKLQEDIQRGVSQSNILQHLPERLKEEFGSEMTQQARTGARIGTAHQRAVTLLEERKVKVVEDAVRVQSGVASQILENQYGVDLSRTLMNLADNPALKKDGQGNYLPPAGAGPASVETTGASAEGMVDEKDVDEKVKNAVSEIVGKTQAELDRSEANRRSLSDQRGRDAEREAELAGEANEGAGLDPEGGDIVEIATRKAGVDLQNPRHLALFVTELARRHWVKEHGLAEDAEAFKDAVALQFLRKTAQDVYGKLVRDITYSQSRDSATAAINGFEHVPTLRGLISEMTFAGQLINARKIRETAQGMCEKLDTFLREKFGATGRFKPDNEELRRKVSTEMELRARYARHAIWLTPNAAGKEADLLQKEIDAAATDFDKEDHDAEQARVTIENIRKINILREFGGLRYKPLAQIQSALEYWDNAQQGEADQIGRENLEREIRTKKAAEVLAKAFRNPKTKYAKDGKALASAIDNYITGHMGFTHLLRDMMRYASDEDAAAAETIIQYLELEIQKDGTRVMTQKRRHADALAKAVQQIYGRNFSKVLAEFCKEDERFAEFMGETDGKKDVPTKGRAMQLMVSLLQVGRQVEVIDETDPERKKTKLEWQGGYHDNIVKHHREAQAAKIAALLSPQDLQLVKWLGNWYDTNRQELSAVCQDLFGIGVYAETSNYMPVKMRLDAQGLEKGDAVGWTIFPKALMPRVRNERDFDTRADILQMFMARMEEGEQWKAHAKLGLEMRGIFGRSELQASVIASHGTKANAVMLGFVTDILAGQGARQRAASGDAVENYTDWIRGWAALGALGGNVGVTFKQTTSIPAFGFEVGLVNTGRYMLSAFTPDGMAAMKKIWDSDERKNRWNVGNSEAVANALAGNDVSLLKRFMRASMITNKVGDCVPGLVCGQGIYRDCIEQGMDEEDAMAKTWMLIERTQQSGRIENQAGFQRRTKFGRALYQFLTTQQQYLSYEARAIRSVVAKPGDLGRWGKLGETLILNHFLLSSAYFWMGQLYKRLLGQEPDEDGELADWMVSCLLGPYGALYGLGITTTEAINTWVKGRQFGTQGQLPSLSWASNFIVHDPARLVGACFSDEKTFDDVIDAAAKWASDSNAIFRDFRKIYRWRIKEEPQ